MDIRHIFRRLSNATMWLILHWIVGCFSYCEQKYYISEFRSISVNGMRYILVFLPDVCVTPIKCLNNAVRKNTCHIIFLFPLVITMYKGNIQENFPLDPTWSILKHGWAGCNENCSYVSVCVRDQFAVVRPWLALVTNEEKLHIYIESPGPCPNSQSPTSAILYDRKAMIVTVSPQCWL